MDQIDYRTLADEKADEFLAEHFPFQTEHTELIKQAYKVGFVDGHTHASDNAIQMIDEIQENIRYNEDKFDR
jgi:hypothetical protein